eukprot:m.49078 g.49078  ORF g.49078 m.49078 type:complete len:99 (+) comp8941_c0_seq1:3539-3835(+)
MSNKPDTPTLATAGAAAATETNAADSFHLLVANNLFVTGVACGMLLSSFTFRNAAGALGGVAAGMWYQQELGAPPVADAIQQAEIKIKELIDQVNAPR